MGILQNEWVAWQFDRAVYYLGRLVEAEYARHVNPKTGKPGRSFQDILENGESGRQGNLSELIAILGTGE